MGKRVDEAHDLIVGASQPSTDDFRKHKSRLIKNDPEEFKKEGIKMLRKVLQDDDDKIKSLVQRGKSSVVTLSTVYQAFKQFEDMVGGRDKLFEILRYCPPNSPGYVMLSRLIEDPEFQERSDAPADLLAEVCGRLKIPFNVVVQGFRDARMARAAIDAITSTSEAVPQVIQQVVQDAQNGWRECTICSGAGRIRRIGDDGNLLKDENGVPVTRTCYACNETGLVYREHDFNNRKLMLEISGVSKKEPLVQNTIDNRSVNVSLPGEGGFEKVMKGLDSLIRNRKVEVIDVEKEPEKVEDDS